MEQIKGKDELIRLGDLHYCGEHTVSEWLKEGNNMKDYMEKTIKNERIGIKFDDGIEILLQIDKGSIHNTMWYDDESESPNKNYENFKEYNLRYQNCNYDWIINTLKKEDGFCDEYLIFKQKDNIKGTEYCIEPASYTQNRNDKEYVRKLTKQEKEFIISFYQAQKDKFIKRLEIYWKKYQNKVHCSGYRANR